MRGGSFVLGPFVGAALALTAACSVTGSDSGSNEGGASGEAGTAGSSGGSAGNASGGSAGSSGGSAGNASGGSAGSSGGSAGNASGGSAGSSGGSAGNATGGTAGNATGGSAGSSGGSGGASGRGGTGGSGALCEDYTDGAFVEFEIVEETFRVWIENAAFITEAQRLLAAGETRVPVFETLVDGTGCDPEWSWHPDPSEVSFADFTIEVCDAVPSYIEENKAEWFDSVGSWCPWSARVTRVTAR
jgi:hypothetical protein